MPYIQDDFLQEVLSRNDIVDVVGGYVQLTKKGSNFWACCPFHGEKTPSFSVKQDQQFFYCFGCHVGGNVIQFIQKHERMEFVDAVTLLAERVRLPMPENKNDKDYSLLRVKKESMYNAMRDAARFYNSYLYTNNGLKGLKYLTSRGLASSIIKRFGLGMAPVGRTALKEHMNSLDYSDELLTEIGLLGKKDDNYFDMLRSRVIFPIIDTRSRVVGFAGRVLDDSMPKYINSPETPIYNKSYVLYGAHYLKRLKSISSVMLVEGYMDVIALHKTGYLSAIASSGTALTSGQARLIKRYCDDVNICYDGDAAGQKATLRALDILHNEGLNVKVITLNDDLDPDDFASRFGMAGINEQIENAKTRNDYKIGIIQKDYNLEIEEERKNFVIRVCVDVLSDIEAPIERSMYVKRLHMKTGFEETVINQEIDRAERIHKKNIAQRSDNARHRISTVKSKGINNNKSSSSAGLTNAERLLFALAINHDDCAEILRQKTKKDDYIEGIHREIAEIILNRIESGKSINAATIFGLLDDKLASELAIALEMPFDEENRIAVANECISRMVKSKQALKIGKINKLLKNPKLSKEKRIMHMRQLEQIYKNR